MCDKLSWTQNLKPVLFVGSCFRVNVKKLILHSEPADRLEVKVEATFSKLFFKTRKEAQAHGDEGLRQFTLTVTSQSRHLLKKSVLSVRAAPWPDLKWWHIRDERGLERLESSGRSRKRSPLEQEFLFCNNLSIAVCFFTLTSCYDRHLWPQSKTFLSRNSADFRPTYATLAVPKRIVFIAN